MTSIFNVTAYEISHFQGWVKTCEVSTKSDSFEAALKNFFITARIGLEPQLDFDEHDDGWIMFARDGEYISSYDFFDL